MNLAVDHIGGSFDHELRTKLAEAAIVYLNPDDPFASQHRAPLNEFIMSVQDPYIEICGKLQEQLKFANMQLKNTMAEVKERKKREHDQARNARMEAKDGLSN